MQLAAAPLALPDSVNGDMPIDSNVAVAWLWFVSGNRDSRRRRIPEDYSVAPRTRGHQPGRRPGERLKCRRNPLPRSLLMLYKTFAVPDHASYLFHVNAAINAIKNATATRTSFMAILSTVSVNEQREQSSHLSPASNTRVAPRWTKRGGLTLMLENMIAGAVWRVLWAYN